MASLVSKYLAFVLVAAVPGVLAGSPVTCLNPQLSCQNTTAVADLCCFSAPGGQLLQTQFWDASPSTGPSNSWTIHGLWPDHCDGTYDSNCDASRTHSDIRNILTSFGKTDLLAYMDLYWKDSGGNDESFWSHEWDTHGTCINTLDPSCYNGYTANQEVVDFFQKTVDLFKGLDSYTALANAGIVPSSSATYTSAQIQAALKASFGYEVTIGCTSGALNQIWYSFDVRGSVQTGTFIPTIPVGSQSTCPATGVTYPLKSGSPAPTSSTSTADSSSVSSSTSATSSTIIISTTPVSSSSSTVSTTLISVTKSTSSTSTSPSATGTPGTLSGSGYLNAFTSGTQTGCLISGGTWYVGGTCATYTATPSGSGFTLSSSKGSCGIFNSIFNCGSGVSSSTFTTVGGYLAVNGNSQFYAAAVPGNQVKQPVYTTSHSVSVQFAWQSK